MSILLSGDFHNGVSGELKTITKNNLLSSYDENLFNSINYHIILGDAGFLWPNQEELDKHNFEILSERKFPILAIIGNHDPVYGIKDMQEEDIGIGDKVLIVHEKNPFIAYLKRGKVYTIDGYKILALGGALSTDKKSRIEGKSWWREEYWLEDEKKALFELLELENKFDFVLSHTGPYKINWELASRGVPDRHGKLDDEVGVLNEEVDNKIKFRAWFCGHWHYDFFNDILCAKENREDKKYFYLYRHTMLINGNRAIIHKSWGDMEI